MMANPVNHHQHPTTATITTTAAVGVVVRAASIDTHASSTDRQPLPLLSRVRVKGKNQSGVSPYRVDTRSPP